MARISLAGFKDPARRPRYIIWTGALALFLVAFVIVALGATSTRWFCAEVCHKVQDDTIIAYNASSHKNISCMACHMPVNADPVTFLLHKATALGELYLTATDKFEIPLNATSHVAQSHEMKSDICLQCHSENREVTASAGIIIDHEVHAENDVQCTLCHNRVAHPEWDVELINVDPKTGKLNPGHDNFMEMTACYRCHSLEADALAPGECSACHPKGFDLKPPNHDKANFVKATGEAIAPHAELAREDIERMSEGEGHEDESEETTAETHAAERALGVEKAYAQEAGEHAPTETVHTEEGWELLPVKSVSYCATCHKKEEFCKGCHGMSIPHDAYFTEPTGTVPVNAEFKGGHPEASGKLAAKCEMCHEQSKTFFCDECHHGTKVGAEFDPKVAWKTQHAKTVTSKGVAGCLGECHEVKFCSDCHTKEKPLPTSHKAGDWLRKPAAEIGAHAANAKKEITACEVCHGTGGANSNFCKSCHKLTMPHESQFTEFHAKTGRDNPQVCSNCHTFKELCSDCHHKGATAKVPWKTQHAKTVSSDGSAGCFEKCHEKAFCNDCHSKEKPLPGSHKAGKWTKDFGSGRAQHTVAFKNDAENCTFCHGEGGTSSKFCQSCHKLAMPHPADFKDTHKKSFEDKQVNKAQCTNCHQQAQCDSCHHPEFKGTKLPWVNFHPQIVRKSGAGGCLDKCHEETFCSYCHVREAGKYLKN